MSDRKAMLVIMDGLAFGKHDSGDAFYHSKSDYIKSLVDKNTQPVSQLKTHGEAVGLPSFQVGGSEAGHMTLGSGRATKLLLTLINDEIESGNLASNPVLKDLFTKAREKNRVHFLGMTSDGGIHSFVPHLYGLLEMAKAFGIEKVYNHCILDGRDVGLRTAKGYLEALESKGGHITSMMGRFYAMDRDKNWDRTKASYDAMTDQSHKMSSDWKACLEDYYDRQEESDYYFPPALFEKEGQIRPDDIVIFWNFRTDRARQISHALCDQSFTEFDTPVKLDLQNYGIFGNYYEGAPNPFQFEKQIVQNTLGEVVSQAGKTQLRITETEKFNHVTFFFNSERKDPFPGEERVMIPSPKCPNYGSKPEMSAREVTDRAIAEIQEKAPDFILYNYANPDMVGHSGSFEAAVKAVETVDECLKKLVPIALEAGYDIVLTADHGNSDEMLYDNGDASASHSKNLVPCTILTSRADLKGFELKKEGTLQDVAPTILELMGLEIPDEMTGSSLIVK